MYFYFVLSWFFDWVSTKPRTVGNCTHCNMSHSEEIKYTAENSLSIGEAGLIPKNKPQKNKLMEYSIIMFSLLFFCPN